MDSAISRFALPLPIPNTALPSNTNNGTIYSNYSQPLRNGNSFPGTLQCSKRSLDEGSSGSSGSDGFLGDCSEGSPPKRQNNGMNNKFDRINIAQESLENIMEKGRDDGSSSSSIGSSSSSILHNGNKAKKCDVDFYVAIYGCSGYGEVAIKSGSAGTNSITGGSSLQGSFPFTVLNGGGFVGGGSGSGIGGNTVENSSVQLWEESAALVLLAWAVVDAKSHEIAVVEEKLIRPGKESQLATATGSFLLNGFKDQSGLDDEQICKSSNTLDSVIRQIDESVQKAVGRSAENPNVVLVTAGPELLRQQLLPECARYDIVLPEYFFTYIDLFDDKNDLNTPHNSVTQRLDDLLENNRLSPDTTSSYGKRHVTDMANLLSSMMQNQSELLHQLQQIAQRYEPGLSKIGPIADDMVVRARGLPWQASDMDVARFFYGLDIPRGGIALCLSSHGRRNGEAIVVLANPQQRDLALQRHKHHMANRYIEVYRALAEDFQQVAGVCNSEAEQFLRRTGEVIIRMRGLPYEATAKEVVQFFANGEESVAVVDDEDGVLFVKRPDGRAAGDAFVLFRTEDDGQRALAKHRQRIGTRYIELFRSTTAEVQQVLNKTHDARGDNQPLLATPPGLLPTIPPGLLIPGTVLNGPVFRNCIRLRGLPFEATVEDILEFLGDKAKHIVVQGVHMVYNAQGQASGEAFIQMDSETAANLTCQERHNRFMNMTKYNKKHRYIEVYQCSADEMNGNGLSLPTMRPLIPHGFAGLAPYQNTFPGFNPNLSLLMSQLTPNIRPQQVLPAVYSLPYWPYPSPPISPTNPFPAGSLMPGLANPMAHITNSLSVLFIRNLPFNATAADVAAFLQGTCHVSTETVQMRPNGEALVVLGSREEADRAVLERNRKPLGNRLVEMAIVA